MKNEIYQRVKGPVKRELGVFYPTKSNNKPITFSVFENKVIGLLVARKDENNKVHISWSLLNPCDKFNLEIGLQIARNKSRGKNVPYKLLDHMEFFVKRAKKYFKDGIFEDSVYIV